jgi:hypothetical protein
MAKVNLNKEAYNKNQYQKVIDISFTQLVQPSIPITESIPSITVAEFFTNYQEIFFQIPKLGDINSHEYLVKTSQEYIGSSNIQDDTIQALIDEITQLRQENLDLQQQITSGSI